MPKIKVLSGGGFPTREVRSTTVGGLRDELKIAANANVNVNGDQVGNDYELQDNDTVAAVSNDKTGGRSK
jgi:molybdopterin converting factor small subunit